MGIIGDKINERVAEAMLATEQHTAQMAAGLAQFQNGNRLTAARPVQLGGHPRVVASPGRLVGWSLYADGGPVQFTLRDARGGPDGDVVAALTLADGESSTQWMGPGGISFGEGLWLDVSGAGAVVGTVWTGAVD